MYLSHLSEPIRQRRCATGDIGQSLNHPIEFEPPVEPVGELTEVAPQVLSVNRVIGPVNGILDVPEHRVDPGKLLDLHARGPATGCNAPVWASVHDRPEARQSVGGHFGIRRKVLTRPTINRIAAKALQRRHAHRQRPAVAAAGHRSDKRRLSGCSAPPFAAAALATPESVVDLDRAAQRPGVITFAHRFHKLVLDQPGGFVRHPEVTGQCHCRQPTLALCEQKNRQKPGRQRQFGLLEQRSGSQRCLMVASMALKYLARVQFTVGTVAALRAAEASRPAQLEKRVPAGLFGAVAFEEFGQTETFLKLNRIPSHFVTSCLSSGYDGSKRPSQ